MVLPVILTEHFKMEAESFDTSLIFLPGNFTQNLQVLDTNVNKFFKDHLEKLKKKVYSYIIEVKNKYLRDKC